MLYRRSFRLRVGVQIQLVYFSAWSSAVRRSVLFRIGSSVRSGRFQDNCQFVKLMEQKEYIFSVCAIKSEFPGERA